MSTGTLLKYETLGQQADALQIIFETLPLGVIVADTEGRILFFNPAAETILGIDASDAGTLEWTTVHGWYLPDKITLIPPERLPLVRALRGEEVIDQLIFVRNPQQAAGVWIRASSRPLPGSAGVVSGGVVIFEDVTERRTELQRIILLSQVVEQIGDSVMLTDRHGTIEYVNPAFELTTGYSQEDVRGRTPRILKSGLHDEEFYRQLWRRLMEGQPFHGMIINRKKTGQLCWSQQSITPIRDFDGNLSHFVSVLQDITEIRQKQEHEFQLRLAREVQQQFYGSALAVPGFDFGAAAYPAYEIGGDYFDFIPMPNGCVGIAVGDVEGHGFGSALVMALTRAYLRSFVAMELELHKILTQVNQMLAKDLNHGHFVTLALARLDPEQRTMAYASAGHVPGYVLLETGEVQRVLESTGPPLGLFADSKFSCQENIRLDEGQLVVLLTDGVTESRAPDGTEFGAQRALEYIQAHRHDPAREIVDGLYLATRAFVKHEPQVDDIMSIILKVNNRS
jgi:sigma-B regulation protein RsbU (phosphoserine phosphatase)